jgi:transcription elongation GreA/GreB family factor
MHTALTAVHQAKDQAATEAFQGKGMGDGDQFHSTAGRSGELQAHLLKQRAGYVDELLRASMVIDVPDQTDTISLGHKVLVEFDDDPDVIVEVHILGKADQEYFTPAGWKEIDMRTRMIVSTQSSVGKALLGAKRGSLVKFNGDGAVMVQDTPDAISVSEYVLEP